MPRFKVKFPHAPRVEALEARALLASVVPGPVATPALVVEADSYSLSRILVRYRAEGEVVGPRAMPEGEALGSALGMADLRAIDLAPGVGVADALATYRADPFVLYAEPDYTVHADSIPNDPQFGQQWGLDNTNRPFGGLADADIDAPEAWNVTTGDRGIIVAEIDTGVDYTHPDLAANIWTNTREIAGNGIDDDGNGYADDIHGYDFANNDGDPMDDNGHGTHVAGIMGALGNNGVGGSGVARNVSIMALKFLGSSGSGSTSGAISALNYAVANGALISNNSWGGGGASQALANAITAAGTRNHIFVVAAGNGGSDQVGDDNDATPNYPSNYTNTNILAVAASTPGDALASYSNYGATSVDLAAPGSTIYSTLPGNSYGYLSGTSMATPMVSGTVALVRGQHPTWTATQVINQILSTVDPVAAFQGKLKSGGRLNAARAVGADLLGASVTGSTPTGTVSGPIGSVRLTFSEAIDPASFTAADVVGIAGPSGSIAATGVAAVAGSGNLQFDVTFAPQSAAGSYTVTVGPNILDAYGNAMDQDGDGINGEATDDRYTAAFAISAPATTPTPTAVVDNSSGQFAESGAWGSWGDGYGGWHRYAVGAANSATFTAAGLAPADYAVQATWAAYARNGVATYRIYDGAALVAQVAVDQRLAPAADSAAGGVNFQTLATVRIAGGTLRVTVVGVDGAEVQADAVAYIQGAAATPTTPTPTAVVDNSSGQFAESGAWGSWGDGYGGWHRYAVGAANSATFTAAGLAPADYAVQATWAAYARNGVATYRIYDGAALVAQVAVDQRLAPAADSAAGGVNFQTLATVRVAGGTLRVTVVGVDGAEVQADAVAYIQGAAATPTTPTPTAVVDNSSGQFAESGAWGSWGDGYGGWHRYAVGAANSATFTAAGLAPADYAVQATWAAYARNGVATYRIYDGAALVAQVAVDQRLAPAADSAAGGVNFQTLATVRVAGGTLRVTVVGVDGAEVQADAVAYIQGAATTTLATAGANPTQLDARAVDAILGGDGSDDDTPDASPDPTWPIGPARKTRGVWAGAVTFES